MGGAPAVGSPVAPLLGRSRVLVGFLIVVSWFQWLWNTRLPELFGLRAISYWQAFR